MDPTDTTPASAAVPHIRTFHARHGRVSRAMVAAIETLGPARRLAARPDPQRPLVIEVGCGHGEAALAFAEARPDVDVLAIDVHTPGIAHLLLDADERGLGNLFVERADAVELLAGEVANDSLVGVHLFFPDPWPKTRHRKRRFVRPDVLDLLAERMRAGADLRIATDVEAYADWAVSRLDAHPCFDAHPDAPGGVARRPSWRPITGYEARGQRAGRTVTDLHHQRC